MNAARILALESAFLSSWPALGHVYDGQWVARFAAGYTKRANSVTCLGADGDPARIDRIAAHYHRRNQKPIFRISPLVPEWLDAALAGRGYTVLDPTLTLIADGGGEPDPDWHEARDVTDAWCAAYAAASGVPPHHVPTMRAMFSRIIPEVAFGTLRSGGEVAGWAMVVRDGAHVGIADVVIRPELRGRGLGRRLMRAVLAGAAGRTAWLHVTEANTAARGLYAALGFTEAYRCHYRIAPDR